MNIKIVRKITNKVKKIFFKLYLNIRIDLKNNKENLEIKNYWKVYCFLEKKYRKVLANLPTYSGSGEYSNYVWWCWLQGEENAPEIVKACLHSLRKNLSDRKIIVITSKNINKYITMPKYIEEKYKKGIISHAHYSDLVRLQLLIKYGGTWIDSTVYCTKYNKNYFDKKLFVFSHFMRGDASMLSSNWFITAEKDNPILKTTRDLLLLYWKKHNFLLHYYIFHFFFHLACNKYPEEWKRMSRFSNVPPHILQFELCNEFSEERFQEICQISDFHKLTYKLDTEKKGKEITYYDYIISIEREENK